MRLFCDMDGVVADFERGYAETFGIPCTKTADNVDWDLVRTVPNFYETLPLMADAPVLWSFIRMWMPTFLTGVPLRLLGDANTQKHRWIARRFGAHVPVITCQSKNKRDYCKPGDVIIDDWEKHKARWEAAGGIWVTHTDAVSTIKKLRALGFEPPKA